MSGRWREVACLSTSSSLIGLGLDWRDKDLFLAFFFIGYIYEVRFCCQQGLGEETRPDQNLFNFLGLI